MQGHFLEGGFLMNVSPRSSGCSYPCLLPLAGRGLGDGASTSDPSHWEDEIHRLSGVVGEAIAGGHCEMPF